ncbi:MAG TPA: Mu transposase C-terminal domain-containing protein, partial [Ktedonobacteraceae bacterium]|nr:Mu transposase C-terminal domain-containing protein [Ktedonobacteraceae bacterium]
METQHMPSARPGTPGLDVFQIAGQSISGFIHSFKTGDPRRVRQPFTSRLEEQLCLFLEYHPHVSYYQRGDASPACATAYGLVTELGTPYRINYVFEDKPHEYLPDFVGTLCDGGLLIAEAGRESEKSKGKALVKAESARRLALLKGGVYWLGTETHLSERRHQNWLYLHARRQPFSTFDEIAAALLAHWSWGKMSTVNELVKLFGPHWSEAEVEAAVWKLAGDAAACGHLLVDLAEVELSHATPLSLLAPDASPILPDPLPSELICPQEDRASLSAGTSDEELVLDSPVGITGPTFDASVLSTTEEQAHFHRNLAAVTAALAGMGISGAARAYGMATSTLSRLVRRTKQLGQIACVPYATYHRDRALHPDFQQLIRKLYMQPFRPTVTAICEDIQLKQLAETLSEHENKPVSVPPYHQVYGFVKSIEEEIPVKEARSGQPHAPRARMSPKSFVLSIPYPAHICQVDEHTLDLLVVASDGTVLTRRVHGAVLICVKTAAILGAVLSLDSLREEDYMRLVKMAMEPKERWTTLYDCHHPWPCSGKPAVIFHDRGKIFTSERARQVLVDRLGIVTEQAPAYAPSAKGTVESLFTWVTRKLTHRLPGTTKSTPADRGIYDSRAEAEKAGITLDVLEKWFIQAIVDAYMQEWDRERRGRRTTLWEESVQKAGVPRYLGSPDDLKLLLMKAVNRRNKATGRYAISPYRGLSFLGYRYVSPGLLDRLRGREIDIFYDRRDISVIYLFEEGELRGEAYCTELLGERLSIWEAQARRKSDTEQAKEASMMSLETR